MHILITIGALVLCVAMPLYAQDPGETEKAIGKKESVVKPVKKETGLMDLLGGEKKEDTKGTMDKKTLVNRPSDSVSESIPVDEPAGAEEELDYLDEDEEE